MLVEQPRFAIASLLLSVLGEGTFRSLLRLIERYAPDPVTAAVARLAGQDEARHEALRQGSSRIHQLMRDMDEGRRRRLIRLGFPEPEAALVYAGRQWPRWWKSTSGSRRSG